MKRSMNQNEGKTQENGSMKSDYQKTSQVSGALLILGYKHQG
jgi:hypothetical protein